MTTLAERYPDLLGGRDDPAMTRLVADLDRACAATVAPQAARLDAAMTAALHERRVTTYRAVSLTRRRARLLSRRALLVAAGAVVAGAAIGTVSAGSPLVDRLFGLFTNGTQQAAWLERGADLHLAQSACGQTMALQHAYADANRIVVGYTLRGEGTPANLRLSDADGMTYPPLDAGASAPEAGTTGNVATFDASRIAGRPAQVALRLTASGPAPCPQGFDFQFAVPFVGGQTLDLHQTLVSQGVAVTLDRIVVSPLETRVYVQTVGKPVNSPYLADLTVDGHSLESGFNGWGSPIGPVVSDVFSFRSIPAEQGAATLTISWPNGVVTAATGQHPTSGPWVFHVTLP
jgi:hypothetical protein